MSTFHVARHEPTKLQPLAAIIHWTHNLIILQRPRELRGQLPSPAEIGKLLEDAK